MANLISINFVFIILNIAGTGKGNYNQKIIYKMLELAPGFYINSNDIALNRIEVFAGRGFRNISYFNFIPVTYSGNFYRMYLQLNLEHVNEKYEIALTGRWIDVTFPTLIVSGIAEYEKGNQKTLNKFNRTFFETAINYSVGYWYNKFNIQAGSTTKTTEFLSHSKPLFRAGIQNKFNLVK